MIALVILLFIVSIVFIASLIFFAIVAIVVGSHWQDLEGYNGKEDKE